MEVNLEAVKGFIEANKDKAEVGELLGKYVKPNRDAFLEYAKAQENLEGLVPELDRRISKAVEEFKKKGMLSELDKARREAEEAVEKRLKKEHGIEDDPAIKRARELEERVKQMEAEMKRKELTAKVRDKVPEELRDLLAERLIGEDAARTDLIVDDFVKALDKYGQRVIDAKVKTGQFIPGKGGSNDGGGQQFTPEQMKAISKDPALYAQHRDAIQKQLKGG
jgi:septum formation inhibitor MinC